MLTVHDCSSPDPSRWKFMIIMTWRSDTDPAILKEKGDDAILDDLKKRAQGLASPFRESFETIPDGTKVWHARLTYWPTRPWDSRGGKVTLVGDAAHPMTFRAFTLPHTFSRRSLLCRPRPRPRQRHHGCCRAPNTAAVHEGANRGGTGQGGTGVRKRNVA